jgi:hypothetical protein
MTKLFCLSAIGTFAALMFHWVPAIIVVGVIFCFATWGVCK